MTKTKYKTKTRIYNFGHKRGYFYAQVAAEVSFESLFCFHVLINWERGGLIKSELLSPGVAGDKWK